MSSFFPTKVYSEQSLKNEIQIVDLKINNLDVGKCLNIAIRATNSKNV